MKSVKFNKFVATVRVLSSSKCTETRLPGGAPDSAGELTTPSRPRSWLGRRYPSTFRTSLCLRRLVLGAYGFVQL